MKLKFLLTSLFVLTMATTMVAEDTLPPEGQGIKFETLRHRPKDASQTVVSENVECYYLNGYLHFNFQEPEGNANLSIIQIETGDAATSTFPTLSDPSIYIGTIPGIYQLLLSTSVANYISYLSIE